MMPELRRNLSVRHALTLLISIPLVFLLLFVNERALADKATAVVDRPPNPPVRSKKNKPCGTEHHAVRPRKTIEYDPSLTSEPDFEIEAYIFVGNRARDDGEAEDAKKHYSQALEKNQKEWRAHYGLGNVYFDQGVVEDKAPAEKISFMTSAIKQYEEAVADIKDDAEKTDGEVAELYSALAQAYLQIGESSRAKAFVEQALALKRDSASAIRRQGNIFFAEKNYDEAIKLYLKSLEQEKNDALTHRALGAAYWQKFLQNKTIRDFADKAIAEFKMVVSLRPANFEGYKDLVKVYCASGNQPDAQKAFNSLKGIDPARATKLLPDIQGCGVQ